MNPAAEPALPPKPGMNLHEIMKDYVESMLSEQPGRKALILDRQTLGKSHWVPSVSEKLTAPVFKCFPSHRFHDLLKDSDPLERSVFHRCHRQHPGGKAHASQGNLLRPLHGGKRRENLPTTAEPDFLQLQPL